MQTSRLKPCERCKSQHLKCVYQQDTSKCQRCERSGNECVKSTKKLRFRDVSASGIRNGCKYRKTLHDSRLPILNEDGAVSASCLISDAGGGSGAQLLASFLDTTDGSVAKKVRDDQREFDGGHKDDRVNQTVGLSKRYEDDHAVPMIYQEISFSIVAGHAHKSDEADIREYITASPSKRARYVQSQLDQGSSAARSSIDLHWQSTITSPSQAFATETSAEKFLDNMVKAPAVAMPQDAQAHLETVLLRYFRAELAPWFDICDPLHHFADVLPQSARTVGPLRNAILTIAARNLSHNQMFRSGSGVVEWQGHRLPDLTEELAIFYHNECIRELLHSSLDSSKLCDETLLAAVVILRTDEEMLHEAEDKELFLRIASLFIGAQLPLHLALPHTSPQIFHPAMQYATDDSLNVGTTAQRTLNGLRQACFWTSLRQDLHAAFLKQQSVKFPLARCGDFRQIDPATDAVWAHRMVVYCADVLEFCYGSESVDAKVLPAYTNRDRWTDLRSFDEKLRSSLPSSFEPVHCREPDKGQNETFPSIFYLETTHVSGSTYMELARMLLCWFNPNIPKLGLGSQKATKAVLVSTRKILFRLCGIALSNSSICPPGLVNAALAIGLFGEYFEEALERNALLGVLSLMIQRYNYYPSVRIGSLLQQSWLADDSERLHSTPFVGSDSF